MAGPARHGSVAGAHADGRHQHRASATSAPVVDVLVGPQGLPSRAKDGGWQLKKWGYSPKTSARSAWDKARGRAAGPGPDLAGKLRGSNSRMGLVSAPLGSAGWADVWTSGGYVMLQLGRDMAAVGSGR